MSSGEPGLMSSPEVMDTFYRICKAISRRNGGLTLQRIGACFGLAQELHQKEPDPEKIAHFGQRMGLGTAQELDRLVRIARKVTDGSM